MQVLTSKDMALFMLGQEQPPIPKMNDINTLKMSDTWIPSPSDQHILAPFVLA